MRNRAACGAPFLQLPRIDRRVCLLQTRHVKGRKGLRVAVARALGLAVLALGVQAGTAQAVVTGVFPQVHCVSFDQEHNTLTGIFDYFSANDSNVIIPVGPNNEFVTPPINRGQPVVFFPGVNYQAFAVTIFTPPSQSLTWSLLGNTVTMGPGSPECVSAGSAPVVERGAKVHGTPFVGQPLSVEAGVYKNDVGDVEYQWQRTDGAGGWTSIPDATDSTYTPTSDDAGQQLRVQVTISSALAADGDNGAVTTDDTSPTDPVGAPPTGAWPTISGTALPGRTLTANPGTWTGVSSFTYDWQRCSRTCVSTGVTTPTYTVGRSDVLRQLRVVVRPSGMSEPAGVSAELFIL
jgi:hypothetical protein